MDIEQLGKGAIPDVPDERDYKAEEVMGAVQVDWSKEFRLPDPGDEDQGTSSSCVAQAASYYHNQIHPADYSRRDLYARIFLPGGGAYVRDGVKAIVEQGQATRDVVPDPKPENEPGMENKAGVNPNVEAGHKELNYFVISGGGIDAIAAAARDYKGVIFGVTGSNPGWQDLMNPRPPQFGEATWGHALYVMGYHTHNGKKCLICKSSWCNVVKEHHINEGYFNQPGNVFNAWTLIPKGEQMAGQVKTANIHGESSILIPAATQAEFELLCAKFGKDPKVIDVTV